MSIGRASVKKVSTSNRFSVLAGQSDQEEQPFLETITNDSDSDSESSVISESSSSDSTESDPNPALTELKKQLSEKQTQLAAINQAKPSSRSKHAGRVGMANMTTGFTIGGFLTFLYSTVEKFKAGPSPVPPPFNFIIFPVLGILGLVTAGLSIAQAVLDPTRANIANAVFNTGDGLITAGIIAASLALPAVIIPIIPYVFMGIMGVQLAKKLFEAGKAIYRHAKETDPQKKSSLKEVIAIHLTGATSFGLGITSVGVVMLFAHFALAPIGIAAGVFLSGFMGVLMAKTLYTKHKQAKEAAVVENQLIGEIRTLESTIQALKANPTQTLDEKLDANSTHTKRRARRKQHSRAESTDMHEESAADLSSAAAALRNSHTRTVYAVQGISDLDSSTLNDAMHAEAKKNQAYVRK